MALPAAAQTSSKSAPMAENSKSMSSSLSCRSSFKTAATKLLICTSNTFVMDLTSYCTAPQILTQTALLGRFCCVADSWLHCH